MELFKYLNTSEAKSVWNCGNKEEHYFTLVMKIHILINVGHRLSSDNKLQSRVRYYRKNFFQRVTDDLINFIFRLRSSVAFATMIKDFHG